jgi:peptidoglycan hydrolase-like protein with peptidoglycan-binding domain
MTKRISALALGVTAFLAASNLALADETAQTPAKSAPAKTVSAPAKEATAPTKQPRTAISAKEHVTFSKEDAMALQTALEKAGVYKGKIDGRIGRMTRSALREYQKSNSLKVTGRADEETLSKLGVTLSSSHAEKGTQTMAKRGGTTETKKP